MNTPLYRQELDEDKFPERSFRRGERGLRAELLKPGHEPRLPSPPGAALLLLAVFRLPASPDPAAEWLLEIERPATSGPPVLSRVRLMLPPLQGDSTKTGKLDPDWRPPPGLIYRGAFWVDLSPLWHGKSLGAGDILRLRYGDQVAPLALR